MFSQKYIGVEIKLQDDGYSVEKAVLIQIKGTKINIEWAKQINSIDELEKDIPLILGLNGKGILIKNTNGFSDNIIQAAQMILPGVNVNDFLIQKIDTLKNSVVVICRKDKITPIINDFTTKGFFVTDLFLSPIQIKTIESLLQANLLSSIKTADFLIKIENGQFTEVIKETAEKIDDEIISLGGLSVEQNYILPFSSALSSILDTKKLIQTTCFELLEKEQQKLYYKNRIMKALTYFGTFLLITLCINAILNIHYQSNINRKESIVNQNSSKRNEKSLLEEQLKLMEKINGGNNNATSSTSFYSDRIASTISASMQLTSLKINPFYNEKERDSLDFIGNQINISGTITNAATLNSWLVELQKNDWCKKIIEQNFEQDININTGKFNLKIDVR